jgi:hypothetical protein
MRIRAAATDEGRHVDALTEIRATATRLGTLPMSLSPFG